MIYGCAYFFLVILAVSRLDASHWRTLKFLVTWIDPPYICLLIALSHIEE